MGGWREGGRGASNGPAGASSGRTRTISLRLKPSRNGGSPTPPPGMPNKRSRATAGGRTLTRLHRHNDRDGARELASTYWPQTHFHHLFSTPHPGTNLSPAHVASRHTARN